MSGMDPQLYEALLNLGPVGVIAVVVLVLARNGIAIRFRMSDDQLANVKAEVQDGFGAVVAGIERLGTRILEEQRGANTRLVRLEEHDRRMDERVRTVEVLVAERTRRKISTDRMPAVREPAASSPDNRR